MMIKYHKQLTIGMMLAGLLIGGVITALRLGAQSQQPLQITIALPSTRISSADPMVVSVKLKNVGTNQVVIPLITQVNQDRFIQMNFTDDAGVPVGFIGTLADSPKQPVTSIRILQPGEEILLTVPINQEAVGPLAFTNPSDATSSLDQFKGLMRVSATFRVDNSNLPAGSDPAIFRGTIHSTDVEPVKTVTVIPKDTGDLNADGKVDCLDVAIVRAAFGKRCGQSGFDLHADVNNDCVVDIRDLAFVSQKLPAATKCP